MELCLLQISVSLSTLLWFVPNKNLSIGVGALVYWLWETTHVQEVVGSNPGA